MRIDILPNVTNENLDEELLKQWSEQVKRSAGPVLLSMSLIAYMASKNVSAWWWGPWLALVIVAQSTRFYYFRRLPEMVHLTVSKRVNIAATINLVQTTLHSFSLVWFPIFTPYFASVQSMLFIGMGVGSVMMSTGYKPFALTHIGLSLVPLFSMWVWSALFGDGGEVALVFSVAGFAYCSTIYMISVHIFTLYQTSFDTRQQLQIALTNAEAAGRAKTRFLASASHDLRQPIHAISLYSAALGARNLDVDSGNIVEKINASVEALSYELDGLLDISKLDAGIVTLNPTRFCLAAMLRHLRDEFTAQAESREIKLLLDCPDRAPVKTDGALLKRILGNLLNNAINHNWQCKLSLQLERSSDDWQVTVADTGCGIPPEEHEKIFEEFYQLDNAERDRQKGLGLGLSIVRRLSNLLDFRMEFQSAPGKGTQFRFTIPSSDNMPIEIGPSVDHSDKLQTLRILVIDDEQSVRDGLRTLLENLGCSVNTADSSDAAISVATNHKPNIALVDLRLRNFDNGLIAIERLRRLYPDLPAIIISGDTEPARLLAMKEANLPVLVKPVLPDTLKAAIITACRE